MSKQLGINLDSLKTRREWKRHKVKDGNNVFRILPPFGENSNGYPYRKWQIIWGLKNPEDGRMRPYASSMTSEKKCPVTDYVTAIKKKAEVLKAKLQAAGSSEEEIKERVGGLLKLASDLSPKTVYIYNAVDKAGDVGLLELKSTAHKKMKTEMMDYINTYNQDPTSLNSDQDDSGVWFNITRQGQGRDTEYDVKKCQSKVKDERGRLIFEDDRSPLPDNVVSNYSNLGYDLSGVYQIKTFDELEEILHANMADIIAAFPDADLSEEVVAKPAVTKPAPVKAATTKVTTRFDDEDDSEDETPVVAKSTKATPSAAQVKATASLNDDDDFIRRMEAELLK